MQNLFILSLLGFTLAHQAQVQKPWNPSLLKRVVDLDQFRVSANTTYTNATATHSDPATKLAKRENYVDTATALVQSLLPNIEFRIADHYVGTDGVSHVYFKQTLFGLDIDNSDFNVNIAKDGSVFSHGSSFYTGAVPDSTPLKKREHQNSITALSAVSSALQLDLTTDGASADATDETETYTITGTSGAVTDPEARLVYFVKGDGTLTLTWRIETDISTNWLLSYVDAYTPTDVLGVINYVSTAVDVDASYLVYQWGINDPDEAVSLDSPRQIIENPWDLADSPLTWHNDGSETYDTTRGNNAIGQVDPEGETCGRSDRCYLDNYRPESTSYNFSYVYNTSIEDPSDYYNASVTQLFYTANTYHDLLYELGFTELAYNFQIDNEGLGGSGDDYVILNAQDGAGTNNADFSTPPDGKPGRMRMYLWDESTPVRDAAFEAGVIIHEYTHGLSNRLTGGGSNSGCLSGTESGGMGEGWGDFMATAIRIKEDDTRDTDYTMGAWVYNNPAGIRAYPYSTNMDTNPYTYADVNGMAEVHSIGTIWATILYEILWNLIDKYGSTADPKPTFDSDGVPTDGRYLTMKLVVDGMALQPCNPDFVSARDAILDADTALTGGENACELWTGFAKRGLGEGATYSRLSRTESFDVPTGVC